MTTTGVNAHADLDGDLVQRLRQGDLDALGLLYQRHGGAVRSLVRRSEPTMTPEDADDLCQETFLAFHDGLRRYRHGGRLRSWLYGIALKKARSYRRREALRGVLRSARGVGAAGVALRRDDPEARVDAQRQIGQALARLPAAQREVLVLTALEGLAVQEAAAVLGISENAASTRLYRARRALEQP